MKVLIVDDEPLAVERLQRLLEEIDGYEVIGDASNGVAALQQAQQLEPDLLLLDVQMPEMDGLETAKHLLRMEEPPVVVFCTAYDEYALKAFEASAVDYLVKPVRRERLEAALEKASRYHAGRPAPPEPEQRTHLCARIRGNLELIPIEDVICLIAEHKYVTVVQEHGETLIEEPLIALEEEFGERFLRVHRNALVSMKHVRGLEKSPDGGTLITLRGTDRKLDISRRNLPDVRKVVQAL
ncbi:MAG: LytTR family DNA-binding domain-containing protein [Xanthomonadales bacterium]|nr:LytTR family DNA-binding domain-containing protein [Xanthomonadales bacterium]